MPADHRISAEQRISSSAKTRSCFRVVASVVCFGGLLFSLFSGARLCAERPNILIAIADDQSYPHASAYGDPAVRTPGFDSVARAGVLFTNAFTPAPGCSPMRAAFLTGREIWQLGPAGTHASSFPAELPVFTRQLAAAGYHVGMTGKGWGPGNSKIDRWEHNPAGKAWNGRKWTSPKGVSSNDYAANFEDFLRDGDPGEPFCFWFGAHEPHRTYDVGVGKAHGVDPAVVKVPAFLPDSDVVRGDLADYLFEIETFDAQLRRMIEALRSAGRLDNTLIVVTSDNGMPFPRAKANLYEYGIHMPLAIAWPARIRPSATPEESLVSLVDVTRTIFDAAGVRPIESSAMAGESLLPLMTGDAETISRTGVYSGRERHSSSRYDSLGYPCRSLRTATHLYIRNFAPERWPAGAPRKFTTVRYDADNRVIESTLGPSHGGYHDIDGGPTLTWMVAHRDREDVAALFAAATSLRPAEELYDIRRDPGCLENLADSAGYASLRAELGGRLEAYLRRTGDVRVTDPKSGERWEDYPRYSRLRWFERPAWVDEATPRKERPWLEARRPR